MKKHRGKPVVQITHPEIEKYAENHTSPDSVQLEKLIDLSDRELDYIDMLSGPIVGQLLKMIVQISGAKRILEIGTFTGYSALKMAEALPEDGELITLEMNLRYQKIAEDHFREFDIHKKIKLIKGNAQTSIEKLEGHFDLIFLDADKLRYQFYFEKSLELLKSGGLIIADNVLWDGTVLNPDDPKSQSLADFNQSVAEDSRVEQVLLPIRDGVTIIRKV